MSIEVAEKPWLVKTAINWLETWMAGRPLRIFEWGAGGSTVWFAAHGCAVYTVEAKYEWFLAVNEACAACRPGHSSFRRTRLRASIPTQRPSTGWACRPTT